MRIIIDSDIFMCKLKYFSLKFFNVPSYLIFFGMLLFTATVTSCSKFHYKKIELEDKWDTQVVLENPYKGWYHHYYDNSISRYGINDSILFDSIEGIDHLYIRLAWSYFEPKEGEYDWRLIDDVIEKYVPLGYGISIRITCKETRGYPDHVNQKRNGINYATPFWVEDAGAKGKVAEKKNSLSWFPDGTTLVEKEPIFSWTPDWNDSVFLEKLNNFHKAFAARYDGKPYIRYIDIGSIGDWGEGHTSSSTNEKVNVEDVKNHIDIYVRNYKNTQIVIADDYIHYKKDSVEMQMLYEYCVLNGLTVRDDSPLVDYYMEKYPSSFSVSHPHFFNPLYKKKPIIYEMQHYHLVKEDGNWNAINGSGKLPGFKLTSAEWIEKSIEVIHATYIGFHGWAEQWISENPKLHNHLANRSGYWYFPVEISIPRKLTYGFNMISIKWLNKGVAPAYKLFHLRCYLQSEDGSCFEIFDGYSGNLDWMPEDEKVQYYNVNLSEEIVPGKYAFKIKLISNNKKVQTVDLGLKRELKDESGAFIVGSASVK